MGIAGIDLITALNVSAMTIAEGDVDHISIDVRERFAKGGEVRMKLCVSKKGYAAGSVILDSEGGNGEA